MLGSHDGRSRNSLLAFADATGVPARAAERTLAGVLAATQSFPDELEAGVLPFAGQDHQGLGPEPAPPVRKHLVDRFAREVAATSGP
jgi:hypothetical protein